MTGPETTPATHRAPSGAGAYASTSAASLHQQHSRQHAPLSHDTPVVFDVDADDDDDDDDDGESVLEDTQKLPYSKWRCIALVATVTGASFTNVRPPFLTLIVT